MSDEAIQVRGSVLGGPEVVQAFLTAESDIRARVKATLIGLGKEAQDIARQHAPVGKTQRLRNSIGVLFYEGSQLMSVSVAPRDVYYARFLEFGVVAYGGRRNQNAEMMWRRKKDGTLVLRKYRGGTKVRARRLAALREAGRWRIAPRPYMRPAKTVVAAQVQFAIESAVTGAAA